MGVVYLARREGEDRLVALKRMKKGLDASDETRARFHIEAAMSRLRHPNIVPIYELNEADGLPFFTMQYLEGGNLADALQRRGQFPFAEAVELVRTLARAMHYAHQPPQGIIHRDLKPANVLLDKDGTPRITDFGLAKQLDDSELTRLGPGYLTPEFAVLGTPGYMAPEQASGKTHDIGPLCDVYALGAILYELLTGRPPFRGENHLSTLLQVLNEAPPLPRSLRPDIPPALEAICLQCLRKVPAERYPNARALAEDLERFSTGQTPLAEPLRRPELPVTIPLTKGAPSSWPETTAPIGSATPVPEGTPPPSAPPRKRPRAALWLAALALLSGLISGGFLLHYYFTDAALVRALKQEEAADAIRDNLQALEEYGQILEQYKNLWGPTPGDPDRQAILARVRVKRGNRMRDIGQDKSAHAEYARAISELGDPAGNHDHPEVALQLAEAYHNRAILQHRANKYNEALADFDQARQLREKLLTAGYTPQRLRDLARTHGFRGDLYLDLNQPGEADRDYQKARELRLELVRKLEQDEKSKPGEILEAKLQATRDLANLTALRAWEGKTEAALAHCRERKQRLVALLQPDVPFPSEFKTDLPDTRLDLAELLLDQGVRGADNPLELLSEAKGAYELLGAREESEDHSLLSGLAQIHVNLAICHLQEGNTTRAVTELARAGRILSRITSHPFAPQRDDIYQKARVYALTAKLPPEEILAVGMLGGMDRKTCEQQAFQRLQGIVHWYRNAARLERDVAFRELRQRNPAAFAEILNKMRSP
jgi:serine/threonine protein kinase/tetratricopeptide (TPR) repeat protein